MADVSPANAKKMKKQRPKVDGVLTKVETKKAAAADAFKLGQYGEAVKAY